MAESIVTLRVDTRNAVSSLNNASAATNRLSVASKGATKSLAATSTAAKGLGSALAASLAPILAVSTAVSVLGRSLSVFQSRERDAAILSKGLNNLGEGTNVLRELEKAADDLGNATLFSQDEFTRGFALLTSFRKIGVDSYASVAEQAANIAQINQVDVSTSFMQLAKALQDPERNLANLNRSGIAFSKQQTDVIKKLMKTNQVAKAHTMILDIVKESYDEAALAASKGFAGSVDLLMEEVNDFSESLGKALLPVLDKSVKALTAFLDFLNSEGGQAAAIIAGITLAAKGLSVVLPLLSTNFIAIKTSALIATGQLTGMNATLLATKAGFANAAVAATTFKVALAKTGIGLAVIAFGAFATEILKVINAQKEFNRVLEEGTVAQTNAMIKETEEKINKLQESLKKKNVITDFFAELFHGIGSTHMANHEIELLEKKLEKLQQRLKDAKELDLAKGFRTAAKNIHEQKKELEQIIERSKIRTEEGKLQFDLEQRRLELQKEYGVELGNELLKKELALKPLQKQVDKIKESEEAAKKLSETFEKIGDSIAQGVSDALVDAILQTKSLAQAASALLNDIARQFLRLGINTALGAIFGGPFEKLPGFANGGRPPVGRPSIVGEKGPEIFVPSSAGTIIPNNRIGGGVTNNIVVNVDASGSNVEGNEQQSRELGLVLSSAIQAQLIQEKRPGGLLA